VRRPARLGRASDAAECPYRLPLALPQ